MIKTVNSICILLIMSWLASCGGGSGASDDVPSSSEKSSGSDKDIDTAIEGDEETGEQNQNENTTKSGVDGVLSLGNLTVNLFDKPTRFQLNNQYLRLGPVEQDGAILVYGTLEEDAYDYYGFGFDGDHVDGATSAWFYYNNSRDYGGDSEFYVHGDLSVVGAQPAPIAIYSGAFLVTRAWDESLRMLDLPMEYQLNFSSGQFTGNSIPTQSIVVMEGEIEGNKISGRVNYPFGTDQFNGGIFGPEGNEIAGGFENGGTSVIFYGAYDEVLTKTTVP